MPLHIGNLHQDRLNIKSQSVSKEAQGRILVVLAPCSLCKGCSRRIKDTGLQILFPAIHPGTGQQGSAPVNRPY